MKKIRCRVVSGRCNQGFHKAGDEYIVGDLTPEGMCTSAFASVFPLILVAQTGGEYFWEKDKKITCAACPDDDGVVFEISPVED